VSKTPFSIDRNTFALFCVAIALAQTLFSSLLVSLGFNSYPFPGTGVLLYVTDEGGLSPFHLIGITPFVILNLIVTVWRLRATAWPRWFALGMLIPIVDMVFFAGLCFAKEKTGGYRLIDIPRKPELRSLTVSIGATFAVTTAIGYAQVSILGDLEYTVFIFLPFFLGFLAVLLYNPSGRLYMFDCLSIGYVTCLGTATGIILMGADGLLCLLMVAPLAFPLGMLGSALAFYAKKRTETVKRIGTAAVLMLPIGAGADHISSSPLNSVVTEIVIEAPIEGVWDTVLAFPPIPEPAEDDRLFQSGIAYPTHAEIQGEGVGAIRLCHFSTGTFVEPIRTWDPPHRLGFDVTRQPAPMKELSPFGEIHPPHLDGYLVSERGEFRLIRLDDETTLLRGTTWYRQELAPFGYWRLWSDRIIGRIHERVLGHIKSACEVDRNRIRP